jgi:hypothetical protein
MAALQAALELLNRQNTFISYVPVKGGTSVFGSR